MFSKHKAGSRDQHKETVVEFIVDVILNSVVIVVLFFILQQFVVAPFQVVGNSMVNTMHDGEYIAVSKLDYTFGEPERGDIVVFHPPHQKDEYFIKRIIGIPGDRVSLKSGQVYVNGSLVQEDYLEEGGKTCVVAHSRTCVGENKVYEVPEREYFVLGDNRSGSSDSRAWYDQDNRPSPFVSIEQIQGKTRAVLFPITAIRWIRDTKVFADILDPAVL